MAMRFVMSGIGVTDSKINPDDLKKLIGEPGRRIEYTPSSNPYRMTSSDKPSLPIPDISESEDSIVINSSDYSDTSDSFSGGGGEFGGGGANGDW